MNLNLNTAKEITKELIILSFFIFAFVSLGYVILNGLEQADKRRLELNQTEVNTIGADTVALLLNQRLETNLFASMFSTSSEEDKIRESYTSEAVILINNNENIDGRVIDFIEQNKTSLTELKKYISNDKYLSLQEVIINK